MLVVLVVAQDCLRPAGTEDQLPPFGDGNGEKIPNTDGAQVIVTSYQFHCCADITAWQAHVDRDGRRHQAGAYSITFQVWRPSPTVGSDGAGEYSLVGENRFTSIRFDAGAPISVTPEPTNVISVRPGDVVGFFQLDNDPPNNQTDNGIEMDLSYSNTRRLWYQTGVPQGSLSILSAGNGGTLVSSRNVGPILSINLGEYL